MRSLNYKHIVRLLESFPRKEKQQIVVIMEYLRGGELYEYWRRFKDRRMPEIEAQEIMLQLVQAVDYCHNRKIIHRDLKFQNVMLEEPIDELPTQENGASGSSNIHVKIVDFGIFGYNSGYFGEKSQAGSLRYMAPEILQGHTSSTPKIDVWSLGCILYAMVLGVYAFTNPDKE